VGNARQQYSVPVSRQENWEGCGRKDIQRKIRGRWRCGHRESGMDASRWIFGASASIIFPGTIKYRRW